MFKEAKANIAAAIILAVLVVGGVLAFLFLYDFPDYYKVVVTNQSTEGFEIVAEDGYNKNRIKEGSDFKFTVSLDPEYSTSNITVKVNGKVVNKYFASTHKRAYEIYLAVVVAPGIAVACLVEVGSKVFAFAAFEVV